jgi:predicted ATPase
MPELPTGTVTLLFTDIEGSTRLLHELGDRYAEVLAEHRRLLRDVFAAHGGVEVDTQGDAFFVVFERASGALAAAADGQARLLATPVRVRMGVHTGEPVVTAEGYVGVDVHKAARIAAAGHGGQVLVSSATAALVEREDLRDLGEHRLKDLSAPGRLFQLGDEEFPPLKTLYQTNLPVPATPFLGRERELAELGALLGREEVRLVTLIGPGGTGKTRLGLQAAADLAERLTAGVWWVPLAGVRDPRLVIPAAAQALGVKGTPAEHIRDQAMLLLLDNFEQVVDAADELAGLLAVCPNLRVLVTSRELLRLPGEQAYPVSPLEPRDGLELFQARAQAADPGFVPSAVVEELCARLEQLPLALELAAARVRLLSPEQLLERLSGRLDLLKAGRGVDPRQQTLRATIAWSYELLDEGERQLFARLAVFAGGCTLDSAQLVCEADLDLLQSLVDKSLVRAREGVRFWMLETIREFAAERLHEAGEAQVFRRRHADWLGQLAERADRELWEGGSSASDVRLRPELDNVRAALEWAMAADPELALRLIGSLFSFWTIRGLREGIFWSERVLRASRSHGPARAKALRTVAGLAMNLGELEVAARHADEELKLDSRLGDDLGIARNCTILAVAAQEAGDRQRAAALNQRSVALCREAGDPARFALALALNNYGDFLLWSGDASAAAATFREAHAIWADAGYEDGMGRTLANLGLAALHAGDHEQADAAYREAVSIFMRLEHPLMVGYILVGLAALLLRRGEPRPAAVVVGKTEAIFEELSASLGRVDRVVHEQTLRELETLLHPSELEEARERGRSMSLEVAVGHALKRLGDSSQPRLTRSPGGGDGLAART